MCNFLDDQAENLHSVKPVKVLKKAGLRHETQADWHSGHAVHALYMASQRFMPQTLHTDTEAAQLPLTTMLLTSSPLSLILTLTLVRPESFLCLL
jgi:hypothetical protein